MIDEKTMQDIYKKLSADFPEDAVQRTKKALTKKGYDTTGYGYQYLVDRFNEVLGLDKWGYDYIITERKDGSYKSGTSFVEVTVEVTIWIFDKNNKRSCIGGHTSSNFADAYKGAITNGFKKTAAFWGVGKKAYLGTIDDDNEPMDDSDENKAPVKDLKVYPKDEDFKFFLEFVALYNITDKMEKHIDKIKREGATLEELENLTQWLPKHATRKVSLENPIDKDEKKLDDAHAKIDKAIKSAGVTAKESEDIQF